MSQSKSFWDHPIEKIEEALSIRKQMAALQEKLSSLFSSDDEPATKGTSATGKGKRGGKRTMSPETIAKMRASQQARWANKKGSSVASDKAPASTAKKKKRKLSPEGRARIVAALKARHAAAKEKKAEK